MKLPHKLIFLERRKLRKSLKITFLEMNNEDYIHHLVKNMYMTLVLDTI